MVSPSARKTARRSPGPGAGERCKVVACPTHSSHSGGVPSNRFSARSRRMPRCRQRDRCNRCRLAIARAVISNTAWRCRPGCSTAAAFAILSATPLDRQGERSGTANGKEGCRIISMTEADLGTGACGGLELVSGLAPWRGSEAGAAQRGDSAVGTAGHRVDRRWPRPYRRRRVPRLRRFAAAGR